MQKILVEVCAGTHCTMMGAMNIIDSIHSLQDIREELGSCCEVEVKPVPCLNNCKQTGTRGPVVIVNGELMEQAESEAVMARVLSICQSSLA